MPILPNVSSKLAKHQILNQASTSMLAQANSAKQMYMQLLRFIEISNFERFS